MYYAVKWIHFWHIWPIDPNHNNFKMNVNMMFVPLINILCDLTCYKCTAVTLSSHWLFPQWKGKPRDRLICTVSGFICTKPHVCHNQHGDSQHVHSGRWTQAEPCEHVHLCTREREKVSNTRVLVARGVNLWSTLDSTNVSDSSRMALARSCLLISYG